MPKVRRAPRAQRAPRARRAHVVRGTISPGLVAVHVADCSHGAPIRQRLVAVHLVERAPRAPRALRAARARAQVRGQTAPLRIRPLCL